MLSSDHEQLIESKKGAGHCESNNLALGKIQCMSIQWCYSKLNEVENNPKEQAGERGHEDDKKKVSTACTVVVKMMAKQLKHEY